MTDEVWVNKTYGIYDVLGKPICSYNNKRSVWLPVIFTVNVIDDGNSVHQKLIERCFNNLKRIHVGVYTFKEIKP